MVKIAYILCRTVLHSLVKMIESYQGELRKAITITQRPFNVAGGPDREVSALPRPPVYPLALFSSLPSLLLIILPTSHPSALIEAMSFSVPLLAIGSETHHISRLLRRRSIRLLSRNAAEDTPHVIQRRDHMPETSPNEHSLLQLDLRFLIGRPRRNSTSLPRLSAPSGDMLI